MTVASILIVALVCVVVHLVVGVRVAAGKSPAMWAAARERWTINEYVRSSVRARTLAMVLLWPALLPLGWLSGQLDQFADQGDPRLIREQVRQRDRRIAELERELGIGRPS
jgi:hypothetical protein